MTQKFELGDHVEFSCPLIRSKERYSSYTWKEAQNFIPAKGVIVGKRTIRDGEMDSEFGYIFGKPHNVYLVATNIYQNPYKVSVENIYKL